MVLIVDDDPVFLREAGEKLDGGRGVFFASDATHAKELMGSVGAAFSVAMIDLDLPGQDGFSLIGEMHRNFPDLPLIAISGVVAEHVLESAREFGAVDVLRKPIDSEWRRTLSRVRGNSSRQ
jgi:CheY-like chemotaxis protein